MDGASKAIKLRRDELDQIDLSPANIDGLAWPVPEARRTGPNRTDRGKLGSNRYIVVNAIGIPLAMMVIEGTSAIRWCSKTHWTRSLRYLEWMAAEKTTRQAARRQRLRLRALPALLVKAGHHGRYRSQRHRKPRPLWPTSLSGRTNSRLVCRFRQVAHPFERRLDIHSALLSLAAPSSAHASWMTCVSDS